MSTNNTNLSSLLPYAILTGYSIPFIRRLVPKVDHYLLHATVAAQFYASRCYYYLTTTYGSSYRPPTPFDSVVSAEWLTDILRGQKVIPNNVRVVEAVVEDLKGNRGLASAIARIVITYSENNESYPKSLILKQLHTNNIYNSIFQRQANEALFYEHYGKEYAELIPRSYYQHAFLGRMVILLEDLTNAKKGRGVNFFLGNQIWGVPDEMKENAPDKLTVLKEAFTLAARWHAKHWNDRKILNHSWMKGSLWYLNQDRARWESGINYAKRNWDEYKRRLANKETIINFSDKLMNIIDKSFEHTSWENLQKHLHDPKVPFTLDHGDFHASNMLWIDSAQPGNKIRAFDLSEAGPWEPTVALGQMLMSDVRPEVWRGNEKALVTIYWNELVRNGVDGDVYTLDDCYSQFERAAVEKWIWFICLLIVFPVPPALNQYFHDQVLAFIEEHNHWDYYILKPVCCITELKF